MTLIISFSLAHMFSVLEQIQRELQQWQLQPVASPAAAPTTTLKHDSFGYAIPSKNNVTRNDKPTAPSAQHNPYAVVDVTQKQGKNTSGVSKGRGNCSSVPSCPEESDEVDPLYSQVMDPIVAGTPIIGDEIEPYATVDITAMKGGVQKRKAKTGHKPTHIGIDNVTQTHNTSKCDGTTNSHSPSHKPTANVEPLYAEVIKPARAIATTTSDSEDDMIGPYATVDVRNIQKASKTHKPTITDSVAITCAPPTSNGTSFKIDNSKATVVT